MRVCFTICVCLCVCSTEHSQKLQLLSLSLMLCGLHRICPPPPQPFFLPRATFPVLLSLPAPVSLDFVSDFPRKRLCAGHGVKNTAFLMHSLGKQTKRPLPPLSELASFFAAPLLVWHFLPIMFPVKDEFYIHLPAAALLVELVFVFSPQSINISFQFSSFS